MSSVPTITPEEFMVLQRQGRAHDLIDVRMPLEFREVHAQPARLVPLDMLDPKQVMASRAGSPDQPIYFICKSGSRAAKACEYFIKAGFVNAICIEGGTDAWARAGLPVMRGKKAAVSLERQVRIAAGSLVLIGTTLGSLVHPGFLAIPAIIGAGLIFAGITDTCGMTMLLAKMPWNRVSEREMQYLQQ